jgi:hypothetical protein
MVIWEEGAEKETYCNAVKKSFSVEGVGPENIQF